MDQLIKDLEEYTSNSSKVYNFLKSTKLKQYGNYSNIFKSKELNGVFEEDIEYYLLLRDLKFNTKSLISNYLIFIKYRLIFQKIIEKGFIIKEFNENPINGRKGLVVSFQNFQNYVYREEELLKFLLKDIPWKSLKRYGVRLNNDIHLSFFKKNK